MCNNWLWSSKLRTGSVQIGRFEKTVLTNRVLWFIGSYMDNTSEINHEGMEGYVERGLTRKEAQILVNLYRTEEQEGALSDRERAIKELYLRILDGQ